MTSDMIHTLLWYGFAGAIILNYFGIAAYFDYKRLKKQLVKLSDELYEKKENTFKVEGFIQGTAAQVN